LETRPISVGATADVYLDDNEPLRVFTYGYDSDDFEGWFGSILRNRYDLGTEMIKQVLDRGGCCDSGNIDNDSLGGAFFEAPVTSNLGGVPVVTQPLIFAPSARIEGEHGYLHARNKGTKKYNALFTVALIQGVQPPALQDITSREGVTITRSGFVRTGFDNGMG